MNRKYLSWLCLVYFGLLFSMSTSAQQKPLLVIAVPAQMAWTDTGIEVQEGEKFQFHASGTISLQVGNPEGFCGPEGLDLQTQQQPLPEERLGLLVGKVVRLIKTEVDPETKEIIRQEEINLFPIGQEKVVTMPSTGRLYLGINENVVEDNSGEFLVVIRKQENRFFD